MNKESNYFKTLNLKSQECELVIPYRSIKCISYDHSKNIMKIDDKEWSVTNEVFGIVNSKYQEWCMLVSSEGVNTTMLEGQINSVVELSEKLNSMVEYLKVRTQPLCDISDKYSAILKVKE